MTMTIQKASPGSVIAAIKMFPEYVQKQFLIDRMTVYFGHGGMQDENGDFKIMHMDNADEVAQYLQIKFAAMERCKKISHVLCFVNKPDRLQLLRFLSNTYTFSKKEYASLLRDVWIATEFPHQMPVPHLIQMFERADARFLMTADERKALAKMPEEITVYRGCPDKKAKTKALSWTTNQKIAEWFANRWNKTKEISRVYEATIAKENVYMYTNQRNEAETVVNPNRLKKLREIV